MDSELVIGAFELPGKDAAVLQVLVRLLNGNMSQCLRFSEAVDGCNVVFAPPARGRDLPCVVVEVTDASATTPADTISVQAPLRMIHVMAAINAAIERMSPAAPADPAQGLVALWTQLQPCCAADAPRSVIPLHSGHLLMVDQARNQLRTFSPLDALLSHGCEPDRWRRAGLVDDELLHGAPTYPLRATVWKLLARLAEQGAAPAEVVGRWHLRRWPESAGLMAPGHPLLAAWLTTGAHTVAELVAATGQRAPAVAWFIQGCRQWDLATCIEPAPTAVPAARAPAHGSLPGWLGQLRQKLGLW